MPDPDGRLSHDEREFAELWLAEKSRHDVLCPICGEGNWTLGDFVVAAPIFAPKRYSIGLASYPSLIVACEDCGYTMFFNAAIVGLFANVHASVEQPVDQTQVVQQEQATQREMSPARRAA